VSDIWLGLDSAPYGRIYLAHSDQVLVADPANIENPEGRNRLSLTRGANELDLDAVRGMNKDHGSKVSRAQGVFGQVPEENYRVPLFVRHLRPPG